MSIERSQAPIAPKTAEAQPNKARNTHDAQSTEGAPGGFAAVMEAQEAPPPQRAEKPNRTDAKERAPKTDDADRTDKADEAGNAETADKVAESEDDEDDDQPSSASKANQKTSPQDAAAALALVAAYLQGTASAKPAKPATGTAATAGADGKALAGVAGSTDGQPSTSDALVADGARTLPAGNAAAAAARTGLAADARPGASSMANYASVLEQLQSRLTKGDIQGDLPADGKALQAAGADTGVAAAKSATGLALQNARMDKLVNALQTGGAQAPVADVVKLAGLASESGDALKAVDRFRGESPRGGGGSGSEGAFGSHGFTPTVQFDGTAVTATVAGQATGDAVADQVSYWVSQGVQNASLTLDGLNAERVEVKISMSGNEAHVEFRSDQAATRDMLASTAAQLKDLLTSQGVVLSGVTVGHSGGDLSGGAASQQGRPREGQGGPRGGAGETRAVAAVAPKAAPAPAGTLDLFV